MGYCKHFLPHPKFSIVCESGGFTQQTGFKPDFSFLVIIRIAVREERSVLRYDEVKVIYRNMKKIVLIGRKGSGFLSIPPKACIVFLVRLSSVLYSVVLPGSNIRPHCHILSPVGFCWLLFVKVFNFYNKYSFRLFFFSYCNGISCPWPGRGSLPCDPMGEPHNLCNFLIVQWSVVSFETYIVVQLSVVPIENYMVVQLSVDFIQNLCGRAVVCGVIRKLTFPCV